MAADRAAVDGKMAYPEHQADHRFASLTFISFISYLFSLFRRAYDRLELGGERLSRNLRRQT
jgi:hypothetical protein